MTESIKRVPINPGTPNLNNSKNEFVKKVVTSFLERRNYIGSDAEESTPPYTLSSEQMAVALFTDKASARFNSILFSSINNEPTQVMQHYLKWLNWLSALKSWKIQQELWTLARPFLCHLHLETLRGNHQDQTHCLLRLRQELYEKLHKAHICVTGNDETPRNELTFDNDISESVLDTLQMISTTQDIESYPVVMTFRSCKFRVRLSTHAARALVHYLSKYSHVIMLQVLQTWFDIDVIMESNQFSDFTSDDEINDQMIDRTSTPEIYNTLSFKTMQEDQGVSSYNTFLLTELETSIAELEERPSPMLIYNVYNSQNKTAVTCGTTNKQIEYVVAGFENAEIRLWRSSCLPLVSPNRPANIPIACTEKVDQEEEEIDDVYEVILRGHCDRIHDVAFLESSEYLMSVSNDSTMRAWDINENMCKVIYSGHNFPIWCIAVSSLGMYIATGSQDRTVRIWSPETTYPLRVCIGHTLDVHCTKFHPNGLYVASGSSDRTVRLWNVTDGSVVRLMPVQSAIFALEFSPDGRFLASAGEDKVIHIWDIAVGNRLVELKGHLATIIALCWTTDKKLYSGSLDGVLKIWDESVVTEGESISSNHEPSFELQTDCTTLVKIQSFMREVVVIGVKPYCDSIP